MLAFRKAAYNLLNFFLSIRGCTTYDRCTFRTTSWKRWTLVRWPTCPGWPSSTSARTASSPSTRRRCEGWRTSSTSTCRTTCWRPCRRTRCATPSRSSTSWCPATACVKSTRRRSRAFTLWGTSSWTAVKSSRWPTWPSKVRLTPRSVTFPSLW